MMKPAAIVKNAHRRDQRRSRQDSTDLRARLALEKGIDAQQHATVNRQSAQQGNRLQMHFARAGQVYHSDAQRQSTHRHRKHQRCKQRYKKCEQTCRHQASSIQLRHRHGDAFADFVALLPGRGQAPRQGLYELHLDSGNPIR